MRCTEVRRRLGILDFSSYEHALIPASLRAHLEQCPECREWLRQTRRVSDLLRGAMSTPAVGADFTARVMLRIRTSPAPRRASWYDRLFGVRRPTAPLISPRMALTVLSVLIIIIAAGALLSGPLQPDGPETLPPAQGVVASDAQPIPTQHHSSAGPPPRDSGLTPVRHNGQ